MNRLLIIALSTGFLLGACKKADLSSPAETPAPVAEAVTAPAEPVYTGFNYSTTKNVTLTISLRANNDVPLAGIAVSVHLPGDSVIVFKGLTDNNGLIKTIIPIPANADKLVIDPAYVGLMRNANAAISAGNTINAIIGGTNGYGGDIIPEEANNGESKAVAKYKEAGLFTTDFSYPGALSFLAAIVNSVTYPKILGRPSYLESVTDVISPSLLTYVNASLPESGSISTTNPSYLADNNLSTINVTKTSDIYVTFVSKGANYQSTLAYYTYSTKNPPSATSGGTLFGGIDKFTYVFPNASGLGAGGGLKSGDKVKLGNFAAGTSIGFVLLQNSWTGSGITTSAQKFLTDSKLNPESSNTLKKHAITLYDDVHKLFLTGFEDCNRQTSSANVDKISADNDFNDIVFYTTSKVADAIATANVAAINKGGDSDGDGIQDSQDAFPADASRAYVSSYPGAASTVTNVVANTLESILKGGNQQSMEFGSIAFEDKWPLRGDYDMNDLVVNYRYTFTSNAQNKITEMTAEYSVAAAGTAYKNGFGVQLPVNAANVASVTGQRLNNGYVQLAGNGVEAGQTKAVIVPFDSQSNLITTGSGLSFNTFAGSEKVSSQVAVVKVIFKNPLASAELQVANFNPFIIINMKRGAEVHLPGFKPTEKADTKVFDTEDDATVPGKGRYYISVEGKPWAINLIGKFAYPIERASMEKAYLRFTDWASSNGAQYSDWYSNTSKDYRSAQVYTK